MSGAFAPKRDGEMNVRRAHQLVKAIREEHPTLDLEVWAIAQGLAYIRVQGPLGRGLVTLVLHSEGEVSAFRRMAGQASPALGAELGVEWEPSTDLPGRG